MKNTKRIISAVCAAVMAFSMAGLPAAAEGAEIPDAGRIYTVGGLAKPKITGAAKGRTHIRLKWTRVKGASGYKIYQKTKTGKYKCVRTVKKANKTFCKLDHFDSHTRYTFKVCAYLKKNGRTYYSKYSPAKSVTTKYGLGTNNYSNTNFTIGKIDRNWVCIGDYPGYGMDSVHFKRANTDEFFPPDFRMSVDILNKERWDMTLEDFVEYRIKSEADNYYPVYYKLIEYRKLDGCRCAVLKEDAEDSADYILLALKKHGLYTVIYSYPYDKADIYGKEIDTMVDSIKLTPEK